MKGLEKYETAPQQEKARIRKSLINKVLNADTSLIDGLLKNKGVCLEYKKIMRLAKIVKSYFINPSKSTADIWNEIGRESLAYDELIEDYKILQKLGLVQDMLVYDSVYPRIIGYMKEQLMSKEDLEKVFKKPDEGVIPFAMEFHPSLSCDARCEKCSNICNGRFQEYPIIGDVLNQKKVKGIIDLGIDLDVRRMSFAGGGEPMLSPFTIPSIIYARKRSNKVNLALYTNGIRLSCLEDSNLEKLVGSLNRLRVSLDASNAQGWIMYKKTEKKDFKNILDVFRRINKIKRKTNPTMKLGASYILRPDMPIKDIFQFVNLCHNQGMDFCDIKDCCGVNFRKETVYYNSLNDKKKEQIGPVVDKIKINSINGKYGEMNVAFEDFFVTEWYSQKLGIKREQIVVPKRCWMARINRKLTIGPYGELYPCSDAANPGVINRLNGEPRMAILTEFESGKKLKKQFMDFLARTNGKRDSFYPPNHIYCVPSNMDFNIAIEKLFVDWDAGIPLDSQPIAEGYYQYHHCRNIK